MRVISAAEIDRAVLSATSVGDIVAALLARPEGGFALEVVVNGASTLVPVDTGLFAAGRVEVGIAADAQVDALAHLGVQAQPAAAQPCAAIVALHGSACVAPECISTR